MGAKSKSAQIGVIESSVVSESHSEVLLDHERNVSPFKKSILGVSSLLFQTDSFSEVGIGNDLLHG